MAESYICIDSQVEQAWHCTCNKVWWCSIRVNSLFLLWCNMWFTLLYIPYFIHQQVNWVYLFNICILIPFYTLRQHSLPSTGTRPAAGMRPPSHQNSLFLLLAVASKFQQRFSLLDSSHWLTLIYICFLHCWVYQADNFPILCTTIFTYDCLMVLPAWCTFDSHQIDCSKLFPYSHIHYIPGLPRTWDIFKLFPYFPRFKWKTFCSSGEKQCTSGSNVIILAVVHYKDSRKLFSLHTQMIQCARW